MIKGLLSQGFKSLLQLSLLFFIPLMIMGAIIDTNFDFSMFIINSRFIESNFFFLHVLGWSFIIIYFFIYACLPLLIAEIIVTSIARKIEMKSIHIIMGLVLITFGFLGLFELNAEEFGYTFSTGVNIFWHLGFLGFGLYKLTGGNLYYSLP